MARRACRQAGGRRRRRGVSPTRRGLTPHAAFGDIQPEHLGVRVTPDDLWVEYLGTLNEELADYFAALRPRYKTATLSNSFVGAREREREAYGFEDLCDVVVYSREEGREKPDPRFYRIVIERLGVEPHEAVFLDDTQACIDGARRVGMTGVLFVNNDQAIAELDAHLNEAPTAR
ncbi:MAG: HAD-IA family hydrolase [Acidimicrobiales bacterium]